MKEHMIIALMIIAYASVAGMIRLAWNEYNYKGIRSYNDTK